MNYAFPFRPRTIGFCSVLPFFLPLYVQKDSVLPFFLPLYVQKDSNIIQCMIFDNCCVIFFFQ